MSLKIYNTLTRKKEPFETIQPGQVRMYVCGPTVYNKAHVGHAMSALIFDIIKRYLEYRGYRVNHVMNFTDVDDKIILHANQQHVDPFDLAEGYIEEFRQNLKDLNILPATYNPRATREIDQIIQMISGLIERGYAYETGGDVYFRVTKDREYGKLSGRHLDDEQAGARIEVDERKEHPMDFALWKSARPGEPAWDSPWGKGRPGWHIECSAMNLHHLGEQIDIHGGGNDLIFPHHENEIAQTESLTGKQFARFWVHNGMLQLGGEKMSKSLGNLVTIDDFLAKHSADAFRLLVLNSGYRGPLTFNEEVVAMFENALERLRSGLRPALPGSTAADVDLSGVMETVKAGFIESMDDDFNSSGALAQLFELVKAINEARSAGDSEAALKPAQDLLRELSGVLGLSLAAAPQQDHAADPFINLLIELRSDLRKQKQFAMADQVRNRLLDLAVILEDSKEGTGWRYAEKE
jgi:cysteinyl-tRNA synthetase